MMRHGFLVVLLVTLWALWWDERRYKLLDGLIVTRDMSLKNGTSISLSQTTTRRRMRIPQLSLTPPPPVRPCHVKFIDPKRAFCYSSRNVWDQIALNISLKLLEHEGGCSTNQLPILDLSTVRFRHADCLHVRHRLLVQGNSDDLQWSAMDQHYLVPYFYSAYYYALPTIQRHVPWTHCVMGDFVTGNHNNNNNDFGNATIVALNSTRVWTDLYNQVRYCDTIITNNNQVLVLADSLQIPVHGVGSAAKMKRRRRRRRPSFEPLQQRLNFTHAQAVADTFPIELFTAVTTTRNEKEDEKEDEETFDDEDEEGTFDDYDGSKTLVIVVDGGDNGDEVALQSLYENVVEVNNAHLAILSANSTSSILTDKASFVWTLPTNWTNSIDTGGKDSKLPLDELGDISSMLLTRHVVLQRLVKFNLTKHYDRFIVTQSNFVYKCPHDVSELDDRYTWVPNGGDWFHRHVVTNARHIQSILNVLEPLVSHPERFFFEDSNAAANLTVETLVQRQWIAASLFPHLVRRFPRPMYAAAAAADDDDEEDLPDDDDDLPKWGKKRTSPPRPTTEEGVYALNPDYEFATCVCNHGELVYSNDDDDDKNETSSWIYTDGYQDFNCGLRQ